jgi:hypothetical protein
MASRLITLAHALAAPSAHDDDVGAPALVAVVGDDVRVLPFGGDDPHAIHPADVLTGFTAPPSWTAIGIVAAGTMFPLDGLGAGRGRDDPSARRVRAVHVVDRSGAWASVIQSTDGVELQTDGRHECDGVVGRVDDLCRRALQVRTAPPQVSILLFWAVVWLDNVAGALVAADRGRARAPRRWPWVGARHPAVRVLCDPRHRRAAVADLVPLGRELAARWTWDDLRRLYASAASPIGHVDPQLAAWFDAGSFSRLVVEGYPSLAELIDLLTEVLPEAVHRTCLDTLRAWHLDVGQPPGSSIDPSPSSPASAARPDGDSVDQS